MEMAANPSQHTVLLAVGTPTPASLKDASKLPQGSTATGTTPEAHASVTPAGQDPSQSGYFETVWETPAGVTQNLVKDSISFNYDGTYVDSYSGSDYRWWWSDIGWYEQSHSIGSYFNSNYTSATVWTYDYFCAFGCSTYTKYSDNNVVAHGNGSVSGYVNTWQDPGDDMNYYSIVNP